MNESIFGSQGPKFTYNLGVANINFTVDTTSNVCTAASAHGLFNNEIITLLTTTTLPAPLAVLTNYYVIYIDATTFKLALTRNGSEIDITTTGTGTHSFKTEFEVQLNYWVDLTDEADGDKTLVIESELEADRTFIARGGSFLKYGGKVLLFQYGNTALARSKFEEIYQFHQKKVYLYKHSDGAVYKDFDGTNVKFFMEVIAKNFDTLDYRDLLFITFSSERGVDLSNNSTLVIQADEIIMNNGVI